MSAIPKSVLYGLRNAAVRCLIQIQRLPVYRTIARWFQPTVEIREADDGDLRQVQDWLNPGRQQHAGAQSPFRTTNLVATRGDRIIGFVQLVHRPPEYHPHDGHWIAGLSVRARYRRLGIGERLSQSLLDRAREEGAREVLLLVREHNRPAVNLYHKLGFRETKIPALEEQAEAEKHTPGYRHLVMHRILSTGPET
jgi:ribosomal protein S18 acetylase RimI-like enzyme